MLCVSCVGLVTWAAWMQVANLLLLHAVAQCRCDTGQVLVNYAVGLRDTALSRAARDLILALSARWQAVYMVTYVSDP
jgi:hypothetical protein